MNKAERAAQPWYYQILENIVVWAVASSFLMLGFGWLHSLHEIPVAFGWWGSAGMIFILIVVVQAATHTAKRWIEIDDRPSIKWK